MHNIVVLIVSDDGNDCRPIATHVIEGELDLASVDVNVGLGLKSNQELKSFLHSNYLIETFNSKKTWIQKAKKKEVTL